MPKYCCRGRSEALNSTASLSDSCETGIHDGATKISLRFHWNVLLPMCVRPLPACVVCVNQGQAVADSEEAGRRTGIPRNFE